MRPFGSVQSRIERSRLPPGAAERTLFARAISMIRSALRRCFWRAAEPRLSSWATHLSFGVPRTSLTPDVVNRDRRARSRRPSFPLSTCVSGSLPCLHIGVVRLPALVKAVRPLPRLMEHAHDLDGLTADAVGDGEWRVGYHELARVEHPAGASHQWVGGQRFDGLSDARRNLASGSWAVSDNVASMAAKVEAGGC